MYLVERMPRHWVPRFIEFRVGAPENSLIQGQES